MLVVFATMAICGVSGAMGQRIAVVVPRPDPLAERVAAALADSLDRHFTVLDRDLADDGFRAALTDDPFNLVTSDARRIGSIVGAEHLVLIRAAIQRRSSFTRDRYFEAYAAIYLVSSRTGQLIHFQLESKTADTEAEAADALVASTNFAIDEIVSKARKADTEHFKPRIRTRFPEYPADNDPQKTGKRPPMPFNRIKPEYTPLAFSYEVTVTVDVEVSINERGEVTEAEIVRWAGYGLDESVIAAVRAMNWRAGENKGTSLPMRVLLRYNFKKIEKEDQ